MPDANSEHRVLAVRRLTAADLPALAALIDSLADYERLPRPDAAARERLAAHLSADPPYFHALIAERDGQAVAYAIYFFTYSTFLARPTLYIEDLFVLATERRSGAGRALMRACAREALLRGCGRIEWQVLDWNQMAIDFYERLGARRLEEWLTYRLVEADIVRLADGGGASGSSLD